MKRFISPIFWVFIAVIYSDLVILKWLGGLPAEIIVPVKVWGNSVGYDLSTLVVPLNYVSFLLIAWAILEFTITLGFFIEKIKDNSWTAVVAWGVSVSATVWLFLPWGEDLTGWGSLLGVLVMVGFLTMVFKIVYKVVTKALPKRENQFI